MISTVDSKNNSLDTFSNVNEHREQNLSSNDLQSYINTILGLNRKIFKRLEEALNSKTDNDIYESSKDALELISSLSHLLDKVPIVALLENPVKDSLSEIFEKEHACLKISYEYLTEKNNSVIILDTEMNEIIHPSLATTNFLTQLDIGLTVLSRFAMLCSSLVEFQKHLQKLLIELGAEKESFTQNELLYRSVNDQLSLFLTTVTYPRVKNEIRVALKALFTTLFHGDKKQQTLILLANHLEMVEALCSTNTSDYMNIGKEYLNFFQSNAYSFWGDKIESDTHRDEYERLCTISVELDEFYATRLQKMSESDKSTKSTQGSIAISDNSANGLSSSFSGNTSQPESH